MQSSLSPFGDTIHPIARVRADLISHLLVFRRDGRAARPVVFGRDGQPEAVLLSWDAFRTLSSDADELPRHAGV